MKQKGYRNKVKADHERYNVWIVQQVLSVCIIKCAGSSVAEKKTRVACVTGFIDKRCASTEDLLGSLSQGVFERRNSSEGGGLFALSGSGFAQIFKQVVSIRVKKLSNTNFKASRHHFQLTCAAYKRLCLSPYLRPLLLLSVIVIVRKHL